MEQPIEPEPEGAATAYPGLGGTYSIGTDRHPVTVCRIEEGGRRLGVRFDQARGAGVFNPASPHLDPERWFRLAPDGVFRLEGERFGHLELGFRERYLDPFLGGIR